MKDFLDKLEVFVAIHLGKVAAILALTPLVILALVVLLNG